MAATRRRSVAVVDAFLAANRANWDDRATVHSRSSFYDVDEWLRAAPGPRPRELAAIGDVAGLRLVHLQCHIGLDTLAWARAGARVTGLDFSPVAIDLARELAARASLSDRATFVCADVHDAFAALGSQTYDVVYASLGCLTWIPQVDRWAAQAAALVAPDGRFYIHDGHPLAWALADDEVRIEHTYFEEPEPHVDESGGTYTDADTRVEHRRVYEWNHSLGEITSALIRHGLRLEWLEEHDWTAWPRFPGMTRSNGDEWRLPPDMPRIPLSFSLLARRTIA
jgi:SAM-dependent methyltransferase